MIPGVLVGAFASVFILVIVIPKILGNQYLSGFGGAKEFRVFRSEFLVAAVVFTITLTMGAAAGVIHHLVNLSCMGSIHYTGLIKNRTSRKKKWGGFGKEQTLIRCKKRNRTVNGELWYMAWQNVTRYRIRFLLTIFSLFLGMEACLGVVVISRGSDYGQLESELPVCKSKSRLRIFLARVNSRLMKERAKIRIYNSKLEVTIPKWKLQNQID